MDSATGVDETDCTSVALMKGHSRNQALVPVFKLMTVHTIPGLNVFDCRVDALSHCGIVLGLPLKHDLDLDEKSTVASGFH